jgi:hypothetical protein
MGRPVMYDTETLGRVPEKGEEGGQNRRATAGRLGAGRPG